jgi:hypothetical protein
LPDASEAGPLEAGGGADATTQDASGDDASSSSYLCLPDQDGDAYPKSATPTAFTTPCPLAQGWMPASPPTPFDCDDTDKNVHPGQTKFYTKASVGGTFDYDCDGKLTKDGDYVIDPSNLSESACANAFSVDTVNGVTVTKASQIVCGAKVDGYTCYWDDTVPICDTDTEGTGTVACR